MKCLLDSIQQEIQNQNLYACLDSHEIRYPVPRPICVCVCVCVCVGGGGGGGLPWKFIDSAPGVEQVHL